MLKRYTPDQAVDIMSRWHVSMVRGNSTYTTAYRHITALDATETKAADGKGAHYCALNTAFSRHGLAQKDASCLGALNSKGFTLKKQGDVYLPGTLVAAELLLENSSAQEVKAITAELLANADIELVDAKATLDTLASRQTGKLLLSFRIKRTVACGQTIKVDARFSAAGNEAKAVSATLLVGAGTEQEYTAVGDLPAGGLEIPNGSDTASVGLVISAPQASKISSVELDLNIRHDWTQDLKVALVAPNGDLFKIWDRQRSYGDGINQKFTTPRFNGSSAAGKWTLTVMDVESGSDTGKILKAGLKVKSQAFQCKAESSK